jgi:hypothetical protein
LGLQYCLKSSYSFHFFHIYFDTKHHKPITKIQLKLKREQIEGHGTIIELETELSKLNKKSLNLTKFKEYIQKKSEINGYCFRFMKNTFLEN